MNAWARFGTTLMIWGAVAGIIIEVARAEGGFTLVAMTAILAITAGLSTAAVWRVPGEASSEKSKRRRAHHLVENMSDDELLELRHRLDTLDEESETLASLLNHSSERAKH
jgi:hypothetical protein